MSKAQDVAARVTLRLKSHYWTVTPSERVQMLLAHEFLAKFSSPFEAYMRLQLQLMRRFVARGGDIHEWDKRHAPAFRQRYGWMLDHRGRRQRDRTDCS